jgi:small subunit ribosomal protein S16
MVRIRLQRVGRRKVNLFRIVVADSKRARDSKVIEVLGSYNPYAERPEDKIRIKWERFDYWKSVGAQLTENLRLVLKHATKSSKV